MILAKIKINTELLEPLFKKRARSIRTKRTKRLLLETYKRSRSIVYVFKGSCRFSPQMMGEVAAQELYNMLYIAVTVSYLDRRVLGAMHKFVYSLPISLRVALWLPKIPTYAATFNSLGKQMLRKQHVVA
jgi:hypothetical protein